MQDEIHVLKKQLYEVRLFVHPPLVKCKCICAVVCMMHVCACISVSLFVFKYMFVQVCVCVCCVCLMHLCAPPSLQLQALQSTDQVDASGHTQPVPSTSSTVEYSSPMIDSAVECSAHL